MNKQTESFYNQFSFFYPLVDIFLRPQKRMLFKEINKLPSGRLLEVGVGNGAHLKFYKKHTVTGIDTSLAMLKKAARGNGNQIELLQMNGEALLFTDASFEYVVLSHVIAGVSHPEQVLEEAFRVLKPGGKVFILNHFTPDNWLQHIDKSFAAFSKRLHFKSVFYIHQLLAIKKFTLLKEVRIGQLSYFKLLIYQKK